MKQRLSLNLYSFTLPVLVLALVLTAFGASVFFENRTSEQNSSVLGKENAAQNSSKVKEKNQGTDKSIQNQVKTQEETQDRGIGEEFDEGTEIKAYEEKLEEVANTGLEVDEKGTLKLKNKLKGEEMEIKTNFPLRYDEETGKVYVTTGNGEKELKSIPMSVFRSSHATATLPIGGIGDEEEETTETTITAVEVDSEDGQLTYRVKNAKKEKFLGLFKVNITSEDVYNADTGDLVVPDRVSVLNKILDFLSF
jgi:hypothetical protein